MLEASRKKIDLLVADYLLPGISGVELMRKVRARNPELKVIFISGVTERKARNEMLSAGAVAVFDKPIPMADFLDAVERCLADVNGRACTVAHGIPNRANGVAHPITRGTRKSPAAGTASAGA